MQWNLLAFFWGLKFMSCFQGEKIDLSDLKATRTYLGSCRSSQICSIKKILLTRWYVRYGGRPANYYHRGTICSSMLLHKEKAFRDCVSRFLSGLLTDGTVPYRNWMNRAGEGREAGRQAAAKRLNGIFSSSESCGWRSMSGNLFPS